MVQISMSSRKNVEGDEVSSTLGDTVQKNILTRNSNFSSVTFREEADNTEGFFDEVA